MLSVKRLKNLEGNVGWNDGVQSSSAPPTRPDAPPVRGGYGTEGRSCKPNPPERRLPVPLTPGRGALGVVVVGGIVGPPREQQRLIDTAGTATEALLMKSLPNNRQRSVPLRSTSGRREICHDETRDCS